MQTYFILCSIISLPNISFIYGNANNVHLFYSKSIQQAICIDHNYSHCKHISLFKSKLSFYAPSHPCLILALYKEMLTMFHHFYNKWIWGAICIDHQAKYITTFKKTDKTFKPHGCFQRRVWTMIFNLWTIIYGRGLLNSSSRMIVKPTLAFNGFKVQ